jgi:hypothetical protein
MRSLRIVTVVETWNVKRNYIVAINGDDIDGFDAAMEEWERDPDVNKTIKLVNESAHTVYPIELIDAEAVDSIDYMEEDLYD